MNGEKIKDMEIPKQIRTAQHVYIYKEMTKPQQEDLLSSLVS